MDLGLVKMGIAQAYDGKAKDALAAAEKAEALIQKGGETPLLRAWLGVLYARAGQVEKARAAVHGATPRFEDLMRRMGPPWSTMHVG